MKYFLCSFLSLIWGYDDPLVLSNNFYKLKTFNYPNSNFKSLEDFISLNAVFLTRNDIKKNINIFSFKYNRQFKNINVCVMPIIVNSQLNNIAFGSNYSRKGIYARLEKSFIEASYGNSYIKLGRGSNKKILYPHHSLIDSGLSPERDEIKFGTKFNNSNLFFSFGKLGDEKNIDGNVINRNFAIHGLEWEVSQKIKFELGEIIIYTGQNRGFDFVYSNPFIPYFLNGLEHERKDVNNDNDNSMVFFRLKNYMERLNTYCELIIDDLQIDKTNKDHALGFKIGFHNLKHEKFSWLIEATIINKWTYLHHGDNTSWVNRGIPIGHEYGPDNKSLNFQATYRYYDYLLYCNLNFVNKGENNFSTIWDNSAANNVINDYDNYFITSFSISRKVKNLNCEVGWSNRPLGSLSLSNLNDNLINGSFYFKLILSKDFSSLLNH